jgi:predicted nucleic acid-binding protein
VILTYVDAGVLIIAARGGSDLAVRAAAILDDPDRHFAASPFLRLEVMPQALFNKRAAEARFYEAFFAAVSVWADDLPKVVQAAQQEAQPQGVKAMAALRRAAAALAGADELVTTEKPARSIHRARSVKIVTIHPAEA